MKLSDLRQAAIEVLAGRSDDSAECCRQSSEELIHELRVYQAELEMQNDELRRAHLELEESRDRFANLFDFAPVGYVTIDMNNRIVEANLTIAGLLGVERGTMVRQVLSRYVIPEHATVLAGHLRDISAAGRKTSCELTLRSADSWPLPVRLDSIAFRNGSRSIAVTDLRENADLMLAMQDRERRLRVVCGALPSPVAYIDRTETYQFTNPAHEEWFGMSGATIAGRSARDVFHATAYQTIAPRIKAVLAGHANSVRVELSFPDSERRVVDVHYTPHLDDNEDVVGCYEMMFDVSDSCNVEQEAARQAALQNQLLVLSRRQLAVFRFLLAGTSIKMTAMKLNLSKRTVERERHCIVRLLGTESTSELVVRFAGLAGANAPDDPTP